MPYTASTQAPPVLYLQSIREKLVHLGHLGGDGQINGPVANLDDESTTDIGVDLGDDLDGLAVCNVLGLGDGGLEAVKGSVVEGLKYCQPLLFILAGVFPSWLLG